MTWTLFFLCVATGLGLAGLFVWLILWVDRRKTQRLYGDFESYRLNGRRPE